MLSEGSRAPAELMLPMINGLYLIINDTPMINRLCRRNNTLELMLSMLKNFDQ